MDIKVIEELKERIKELEDKILRMIRGDFNQICSYCGWESKVGEWEELQTHLKECPSHPLREAEIKIKELEKQKDGLGAIITVAVRKRKKLEKGIKKHKLLKEQRMILVGPEDDQLLIPKTDQIDLELYKLVEKEGR
jgi:SMC interacting uncharacterized protein involved in chromosome segregation